MNQQENPAFLSQRHLLGFVLSGMFLVEVVYFFLVYFFLTSEKPFNFNNNYHLIAFVSAWSVLINFTALILSDNAMRSTWLGGSVPNVHDWNSLFVHGLMKSVLVVFPVMLYFLILDDFTLQLRQVIPLVIVGLLIGYVFRKSWAGVLQIQGLFIRGIYLILFIVVMIAMLSVLTGFIPTMIHNNPGNVIVPL